MAVDVMSQYGREVAYANTERLIKEKYYDYAT